MIELDGTRMNSQEERKRALRRALAHLGQTISLRIVSKDLAQPLSEKEELDFFEAKVYDSRKVFSLLGLLPSSRHPRRRHRGRLAELLVHRAPSLQGSLRLPKNDQRLWHIQPVYRVRGRSRHAVAENAAHGARGVLFAE